MFTKQPEREGAFYRVPGLDAPGLGIEIDESWREGTGAALLFSCLSCPKCFV